MAAPLTQKQLAGLLAPFHIISLTVHPPGRPDGKGYRRIDFEEGAIYVDCVAGESLRHQAASRGAPVHDHDLAADSGFSQLTAAELDRREVALLDAAGIGGAFRAEIARMIREINARGVAPLDIKLGNFIRGAATGRLYWIDFEISRLASQPRWDEDLALQNEILQQLFDI